MLHAVHHALDEGHVEGARDDHPPGVDLLHAILGWHVVGVLLLEVLGERHVQVIPILDDGDAFPAAGIAVAEGGPLQGGGRHLLGGGSEVELIGFPIPRGGRQPGAAVVLLAGEEQGRHHVVGELL